MRFIPSDTVDPANLNRTFQRPSSSHEERSFFIVRLLTERAYFRFGKLLCRPGCVFTLGVVMQDQHRQPCTIAGPYVSQHFLVAVRISKCRARQPRDLTRAAALVKGFGCRPHEVRHRVLGGRRPKASKGGNRGNGNVMPCRRVYGDLSATGEACDWDRDAAARDARVKRLVNKRSVASRLVSCRTI